MGVYSLDSSVGSILLGSWFNTYLFTIELIQAARYFKRYQDPRWIKATVIFGMFADLFTTIAAYATVYLYTITHWGDLPFLQLQPVCLPLYVIGTTFSSLNAQAYLIGRVGRLIRNRTIRILVTGGLAGVSLLAGGASLWGAILLIQYPNYVNRDKIQAPVLTWLSATAGADVLVALALIWTLWTITSSHNTDSPVGFTRQSDNVVRKLMVRSLETGSLTAIAAIATLATYLQNRESNVCTAIAFCLGRLYSLTLLASLNGRQSFSDESSGALSASTRLPTKSTRFGEDTHNIALGGIRVEHVRTVHVDEEPEELEKHDDKKVRDFELGRPTVAFQNYH